MEPSANAGIPNLSLFSEEYRSDPVALCASLRKQSWVACCELGFVVLSYDATNALLKDRRVVSGHLQLLDMMGASGGSFYRWFSKNVLSAEGEAHTRLRRLVSSAFTPSKADAARETMRSIFFDILEPHLAAGRCDFVRDVAHHYPLRVISTLIGLDAERIPKLNDWLDDMAHGLGPTSGAIERADRAVEAIWQEIDCLVRSHSSTSQGGHNLVQSLLEAAEDSDRLSHDELVTMIMILALAGQDTTKNQLSATLYALLTNGDWTRIAEDPTLIPNAVEEALRFRPISGTIVRYAAEDLEYRGVRVPAGSFLLFVPPAANHDENEFRDPDLFDIEREDIRHFTFAMGSHFCLGAHLARAEMQEALGVLVQHLVEPRLDGPVEWSSPINMWVPYTMPISFKASGTAASEVH